MDYVYQDSGKTLYAEFRISYVMCSRATCIDGSLAGERYVIR